MNISRLLLVVIVVFAGFLILLYKLFSVQVLMSEELQYYAKKQQTALQILPAERGFIYDRNHTLLAYSSEDVSFYVDVPLAKKYNAVEDIIKDFQKHFDRPEGFYRQLFDSGKKRICLEEKVAPSKAFEIKKLVHDGLYYEEDPTRKYQYNTFASHILGYTNTEHKGADGIEKYYEKELRGEDGSHVIVRSPGGRIITVLNQSVTPPVNGSNIVLSISKEYQNILEEELAGGLKKSGGKYAVGIIMDPNNGDILAMANAETFNPNKYNLFTNEIRRNKAISDIYEPGSTFKAIAMAAMLDRGLVHPEELIFVDNGRYRYRGITIRDVHGYKSLTVKNIFTKSSNVGMAKLSDRIGKEELYTYVRGFGFGNPTRLPLPGEVRGLLKKPNLWSAYTKVTMSYGYEIAVTPIQLVTAYSAIVNGGMLYKPRLVMQIEEPGGKQKNGNEPEPVRRVISEKTSLLMKDFLQGVVEDGTGKNAFIEGVSIGGKTGTSRRIVDGEYSYSKYNASFVGFFPVEHPEVVILIMVNSPKNGYYGGTVAAPIFRNVAERLLKSDPVLKGTENAPETEGLEEADPLHQFFTHNEEPETFRTAEMESHPLSRIKDTTKMPELTGLSIREAVLVLAELSIEYRISGTGTVLRQSVKPGTILKKNTICKISGQKLTALNRRLY